MPDQRHRIRRQIFDVTVSNEAAARQLHVALARVQRDHIEAIIDRACTEAGSPDRLHRLESLEVDLGRIAPGDLERDLVAKLEPLLQARLIERIREEDEATTRRGEDPEVTSRLELLACFARTGTLPWWADASRPQLLDETVEILLERGAAELATLARVLGREGHLERIVRHAGDAGLTALTGALLESRPDLADEPAKLDALLRTPLPSIAGVLAQAFRSFIWIGVLGAAAATPDASSGPPGFWREALARSALAGGVSYRSLLAGLLAHLGASPLESASTLRAMVEELLGEVTGAARAGSLTGADEVGGEPEQARAISLAQESSASSVSSPPRVSAAAVPASEVVEAAQHVLQREVPVDLVDTDEIYVDDAGLVVLWPFLSHLFERLDLLAEGQFRDRAALHRAVGLLQHLATGDLDPPEYQLALPKALCGMDLTEVFDFGSPVTEAEAEACEELLAAAIAHAPILGEMSIAGLRGSFLLRKGVLSTRDGAWLLRVERVAYDVVLDRFPWGVSWVKLGWMAAALCVEW